ncbi:MAG: hexose kinase [Anaerolineaceae bacterium]|jgi:1-phosphofructokinase family hexose kinase
MILTVTAHAALDRVIFIDRFEPTTVMRASRVVESVGGKGLDVSVVLQTLGAPNEAVSLIAGQTGKMLASLLDGYGIRHDLVWVDGDTRTAHVIVERDLRRHSHIITPGFRVSQHDCERLLARVEAHLEGKRWLVMGGTLPHGADHGLYRRVVELGHRHGVKTLIDVAGEPALQALPARPTILKMNRAEFASTFSQKGETMPDLAAGVRAVLQQYHLEHAIVTCGADGILAVTGQETMIAQAPEQKALNAAGAGDAVSAAVVFRLASGDTWREALRWAAAAGAAVVLTEGTADCRLQDIERIFPEVQVSFL